MTIVNLPDDFCQTKEEEEASRGQNHKAFDKAPFKRASPKAYLNNHNCIQNIYLAKTPNTIKVVGSAVLTACKGS